MYIGDIKPKDTKNYSIVVNKKTGEIFLVDKRENCSPIDSVRMIYGDLSMITHKEFLKEFPIHNVDNRNNRIEFQGTGSKLSIHFNKIIIVTPR